MTTAPTGDAGNRIGKRIRRRVYWTTVAFGIGASTTFYFKSAIFAFLLAPAGGQLSPFDGLPVYNSPIAMMGAVIQLAMRGGFAAALPVLWLGIVTLFKPVLPRRWWWFLVILSVVTVGCFLVGAAFVYYVMLPMGLGFLLNFGAGIAVPVILISEYTNLLSSLMFWVAVIFELPLLMYLLARTGFVTYRHFRRVPRLVVVAFAFFLGLILTPSVDAINQTLLAVPIIALYEVGMFVTWLVNPEEGNYLWLRTIAKGLRKLWSIVSFPLRLPHKIHNKFRDNNKSRV